MYCYEAEKPKLFTEHGVDMLIRMKRNITTAIQHSGAVDYCHATKGIGGDSWVHMAGLDYLVEKGEIREVTDGNVMGQHRVFAMPLI